MIWATRRANLTLASLLTLLCSIAVLSSVVHLMNINAYVTKMTGFFTFALFMVGLGLAAIAIVGFYGAAKSIESAKCSSVC